MYARRTKRNRIDRRMRLAKRPLKGTYANNAPFRDLLLDASV